jgi:agmatinase
VNTHSRNLSALVERIANAWMSKGKLVAVLGGDHSSPLGLMKACAKRHPGLGILHVDAHADLRDAYEGFVESHASIMFNVHETIPEVAKIVQVGIRDFSAEEHALATSSSRIESYYDADLARRTFEGEPFVRLVAEIVGHLPEQVYISFDVDGLDPSLCPNTGTPVPGGLSFQQANALLRAVRRTGRRIVGFDLNEVAGDEWDANVGARLLYKMIGHALASHASG